MSSSKWTLCVCLFPCLLNCSVSEVTTVQTGEDVLLLCQDPRGADVELLRWIRSDPEQRYVFFFRDDRTYENYQHPSFHGRVKLRDPQMKDGDVSVILEKVNIKDTGTYKCCVRIKGSSSEFISSIDLKVKFSGQQQITVKTGDDVTLQCLDPRGGDIEVLEWMKRDQNVFLYRHGKMCEDHMHPSFKNRVKLRDPQMKDGDVSVILNVNVNDTGTYECHVRITGSRSDLINSIHLKVEDSGCGAGDVCVEGVKVGGFKDECHGPVVVLSVVLVLLVVVIFMICRKYKRLKNQIYQPPADCEL